LCISYRQNDTWGDLANINVAPEPNKLSEGKEKTNSWFYFFCLKNPKALVGSILALEKYLDKDD